VTEQAPSAHSHQHRCVDARHQQMRCNHKATCTEPSKQTHTGTLTELARPTSSSIMCCSISLVDCSTTRGHPLEPVRAWPHLYVQNCCNAMLRCHAAHVMYMVPVCFQSFHLHSGAAVSAYTPKAHAYLTDVPQHTSDRSCILLEASREVSSHVK
jgi:hypothetical protein